MSPNHHYSGVVIISRMNVIIDVNAGRVGIALQLVRLNVYMEHAHAAVESIIRIKL